MQTHRWRPGHISLIARRTVIDQLPCPSIVNRTSPMRAVLALAPLEVFAAAVLCTVSGFIQTRVAVAGSNLSLQGRVVAALPQQSPPTVGIPPTVVLNV